MSKRFFSGLLIILSCLSVSGQSEKEKYEQDLQNVSKEIQFIETLRKQKRKEKKANEIDLILLNNTLDQKKNLIRIHSHEIDRLNGKIGETAAMIISLEEDLQHLKEEYARLIQHAYKTRSSYDKLLFIFSAEDFNQAFRRLKYYQQYTDYRERQANLIQKTKDLLAENRQRLEGHKADKEAILAELRGEQQAVAQDKKEKEQIIHTLVKNENELKRELKRKQKQAKQLNKMIADYMKKLAEEQSSGMFKMTKEMMLVGEGFAGNKGKLPWPVAQGKAVRYFGKKQPHPTNKGILEDVNGIIVATENGANARAIYRGTVSKVIRIPGAGRAVLVRHGEYLTVYNHLQEVYVTPGDEVSTKQDIGKIMLDENGNTLVELQVWKGKVLLNPSDWLAK